MIKKSYAKLNIFLKIVGKRDNYHELNSRFVRLNKLFDTMELVPKTVLTEKFELEGNFSCTLSDNTIHKAFLALQNSVYKKEIVDFFTSHKVVVNKKIPSFAGLGGGSSNAATFLLLANEVLNLGISKEELVKIGAKIGADVPFFIHEYESANVSGIGEIVKPFEEELPEFEVITPDEKCETKAVFEYFRKNYFHTLDLHVNSLCWQMCTSRTILETFAPLVLNDLYKSSIKLYPKLDGYHKDGWFMSGSGSSMFKVKNG